MNKIKAFFKEHFTFVDDWKDLIKSYSFLCHAANVLQALSVTGLSVVGAISGALALKVVLTLAAVFGILGLIGRLLPQKNITEKRQ